MNFDEWFTQQFTETLGEPLVPSDGMTESELNSSLGNVIIPKSMLSYYRVAGNHWLNQNHNALRDPASFESIDGYTIFMEENQGVVQWAIRNCDLFEDDPVVYQMQPDQPELDWYPEKYTFSRFIIAM